MGIQYLEPLDRAWDRARRMLFRPFRLEFWLVLGFAAFLANLGQSGGGWNWTSRYDRASADTAAEWLHDLLHTPWVLWLAGFALAVGMILSVVFAWLSARGKFIFLDDVLHERARIAEPWRRHARAGNSLFVFELILGLLVLGVLLAVFGGVLLTVARSVWNDGAFPSLEWVPVLIGGALALPFVLAAGIVGALTRHFVVPVMWKHDLGVLAAWGRFRPLILRHPGEFLVFLILLFLLYCGLGVAILVLGFCSCCVGFVLLAIPYVGSVVCLPVSVTIRGLGPEFLAQFGPEWNALPPLAAPPAPPTPPTPAPPPPAAGSGEAAE